MTSSPTAWHIRRLTVCVNIATDQLTDNYSQSLNRYVCLFNLFIFFLIRDLI